jgi:hypothetical protein
MLLVFRILARRSAAVVACPNSRSNTIRGCGSIGSGVVGDFHEIVFEKKQSSESQPICVGRSRLISSEGSRVPFPIAAAAI